MIFCLLFWFWFFFANTDSGKTKPVKIKSESPGLFFYDTSFWALHRNLGKQHPWKMRECKLLEVVEQSQGNPSVKPAEFPLCL